MLWSSWLLHLITATLETTSSWHSTPIQGATTFQKETQNKLYTAVHSSLLKLCHHYVSIGFYRNGVTIAALDIICVSLERCSSGKSFAFCLWRVDFSSRYYTTSWGSIVVSRLTGAFIPDLMVVNLDTNLKVITWACKWLTVAPSSCV